MKIIPVPLQASWGVRDESEAEVIVTNNTGSPIPGGKVVQWYYNSSMKGSKTLQSPLGSGESIKFKAAMDGTSGGKLQAWYLK